MKIVYLAPIAFNGLKQRPQYIAELLSNRHEIWYIEPTISMMKYMLKGGESYKKEQYDINQNLHIIKLDGKFTAHISLQAIDYLKLNTISERRQLSKLLHQCDIIWLGYSGWYDIISKISDKKIIYDKMDDDASITKNKLLHKLLLQVEPKLINKADIIFVTSQKFYEELSRRRENVYYIPNGYNKGLKPIEENKKVDLDITVYGYVGTIAHWFDVKAIETILSADDKNYVYLVGPNYIPIIKHDRVKYFGTVFKEEIGKYINLFSVCLYPFMQNDFLDTIDPVKIYEYLALNKPVLAVNSIETRKFGELVHRYSSYDELYNLSKTKLELPFKGSEDCINYMKENSWNKRVDKILEYL